MNLGVDVYKEHITPRHVGPGIGLRPKAGRADLEVWVPVLFAALYESIAAHSRLGLNVVADVGHHQGYTFRSPHILRDCASRLKGLPALFVGVRCPIEVIMARRNAGQRGREGTYATGSVIDPPESVKRWQSEVHSPGIYDVEVDTSVLSPRQCADIILERSGAAARHSALREILQRTT